MAIANYEDRFVIPTAHRETNEDAYDLRGSCGFSFGNGCSGGKTRSQPVRPPKKTRQNADGGRVMIKALKALSAMLTYPSAELQRRTGEISEAIEKEPASPQRVRDHCTDC